MGLPLTSVLTNFLHGLVTEAFVHTLQTLVGSQGNHSYAYPVSTEADYLIAACGKH